MQHTISVIIATYNRNHVIKNALDSLIAQSFNNWEAIVVDDGSTDNTKNTINEYIAKGLPVKYHWQTNCGAYCAKNKGAELANGDYITFLDSDDRYKPNHLESRLEILNAHPDIQLLHGGVEIIGNEYVPDRNNIGRMIHLSKCVIGGTFFIEKSSFFALDGFRKVPIGLDADFHERAVNNGFIIHKTDIPTYVYDRTEDDTITKNFLKNK